MRVMVFIRVIDFLGCEIELRLWTRFYLRNRRLAFSALDLTALLCELQVIEPKFPFRQFFDFRFGVNASRFDLPHPIQTLQNLRDPGLSSYNLLLPLSVRFFCRPAKPGALCLARNIVF
jgi:hypothetical protein